jgi:glycosyltransferase involved in cell wall biosynthesis
VKILHTVQRYYPDSGGSEEVVKQLSERLAAKGHDVTVATSETALRSESVINGVNIKGFRCSGNIVEGIQGDIEEFRDFVRCGDFDIIMNYAGQIWSSDLLFDLLPTLRAKKVFVPCGYSRLHDSKFTEYYKKMPQVLRLYDKVIYLSENYIDAAFAKQHSLNNGQVIPNGANLSEFEGIRKGKFRDNHDITNETMLINISNHSVLKNHKLFWNCVSGLKNDHTRSILISNPYKEGLRKWLKECYTECRLNSIRYDTLILENANRKTIAEALTDADVFIFGSKVECSPLVMFEAFASKTLFITTDCGNVRDYEDIAVIVENERQATDVVRLFQKSPDKYIYRIEKGFEVVQNKLNWDVIASSYETLYHSLCR